MKFTAAMVSLVVLSSLASCDRIKEFAGLTESVEDVLEARKAGKFNVVSGGPELVERLKEEEGTLVVVDYYKDNCVPCKALAPGLETMAEKYGEKVLIVKMNVDAEEENRLHAVREGVKGLPTLDFFINGNKIKRLVGGMDDATLESNFEEMIGKGESAASRVVLQPVQRNRLPAGVVRVKRTGGSELSSPAVEEAGKMTPLESKR